MRNTRKMPAVGDVIFFTLCFVAGCYFTFAAVQGEHGIFRRVQIVAEKEALIAERDRMQSETARMTNLTRRLSDDYLDLDLLDEQARNILGLVRSDEIVIH